MKYAISILGLSMMCLTSSCSVYMAAKREGISIDEMRKVKTRGALLSLGATALSSKPLPEGGMAEEYRIQVKTGSIARSLMHGLLDVGTMGLWEVVGTPIEGSMGKDQSYPIRVYYNAEEEIQKIELL
ncbi:MAG: hypothetical protein K0S07_618 [Chlamydiales bacterium]|jgi:hypothetical protein|nr:hypothetical protein [Chlamydiales bacterium]